MHGLITPTSVLDIMLATGGILDGIRVAIFATNEPLGRSGTIAAGLTTTDDRHTDGAHDYTSQPISIHCISPRTRGLPCFHTQLWCQRVRRKTTVISEDRGYAGVPPRARAVGSRCKKFSFGGPSGAPTGPPFARRHRPLRRAPYPRHARSRARDPYADVRKACSAPIGRPP